jgi:predicted RNA-binding protein with PUA-like domain
MPNRWLLKTEPEEYSFDDLVRERHTVWDGVSNPLALRHLRAIRKGDELLIYHTGTERAAVGLAKATTDPYPDPGSRNPRIVVVNVAAIRRLPRPVALQTLKADRRFAGFELIRIPRLSVMPVPHGIWKRILGLAGR